MSSGGFIREGRPDTDVDDAALDSQLQQVLAAILTSKSTSLRVGWIGGRTRTLASCARVLRQLHGDVRIFTCGWAAGLLQGVLPGATAATLDDLSLQADVVLVDFGVSDGAADPAVAPGNERRDRALAALVRRDFNVLLSSEPERQARQAVRRPFVCIDGPAIPDERLALEPVVTSEIAGRRVVYGFVNDRQRPAHSHEPPDAVLVLSGNLIGTMFIGESGERVPAGVVSKVGTRGVVLHGPHRPFPAGHYRADVDLRPRSLFTLGAFLRPVILEVAVGTERLALTRSTFFLRGTLRATFRVPELGTPQSVYLRVVRGRWVDFVVTGVRFTPLASDGHS